MLDQKLLQLQKYSTMQYLKQKSRDKVLRTRNHPDTQVWGLSPKSNKTLVKKHFEIGYCINNSLPLARKYARIFVRGHYLFREANSFPRAKLEENCEP